MKYLERYIRLRLSGGQRARTSFSSTSIRGASGVACLDSKLADADDGTSSEISVRVLARDMQDRIDFVGPVLQLRDGLCGRHDQQFDLATLGLVLHFVHDG